MQAFIKLLCEFFTRKEIQVIQAEADADVLIAKTGIKSAETRKTVVIGEDTDLLVLLLFHCDALADNNLFFKSDQANRKPTSIKIWDIVKARHLLGNEVCQSLPFLHALTGCDTTSRMFGIGKGPVLKKAIECQNFRQIANTFLNEDSTEKDVVSTGVDIIATLYGGMPLETLETLRYRRFACKVLSSTVSFLQVQSLPPTTAAAEEHCKRTFFQVMEWTKEEVNLDPLSRGWSLLSGTLVPVKTKLPVAPDKL